MHAKTVWYISQKSPAATMLANLLKSDGTIVQQHATLRAFHNDRTCSPPDLVLMELTEPSLTNLTSCQETREIFQGFFIILFHDTANAQTIAQLALKLGVDLALQVNEESYGLTAANIQKLLNRFVTDSPPSPLVFGELIVDPQRRDALLSGSPLLLSTIEFQLLWILARHSGSVVSRSDLHKELYQQPYNGFDRTIDLYISRIRGKIGDCPRKPNYLKTVRGLGYQLMPADMCCQQESTIQTDTAETGNCNTFNGPDSDTILTGQEHLVS